MFTQLHMYGSLETRQGRQAGRIGLIKMVDFRDLYYPASQKKMKEHKKMVDELKKGDEIITGGGIYGTVEGVTPDTLTVKIAEGTKVKITRSSVGHVLTEKDKPKE
jgi:preprotein translocase subunit YajC